VSPSSTRIAEYENRVQRLESLLEERSAAQPLAHEQPLPPADRSVPLSAWVGTLREELISWPIEEGPHINLADFELSLEGLEENTTLPLDFDTTVFQNASDSKVHSAAAFDSVIFPNVSNSENHSTVAFDPLKNLQIDSDFSQDVILQPALPNIDSDQTNSSVSTPLNRAMCDSYLPPPELGTSLLSEFLVDFNTAVPLYRPYPMVEHIRRCYTGGSDGTPISWASAYVIFGIAHRLRAMSAAATPEDNEKADYYLARILEKVAGLLLGRACLCLVQCLLGTAFLIQTSSHPEPHALFVFTALRMAQSLAYNDDQAVPLAPGTDEWQDIEQQRRVFWIAFFTNTDESILSNAPTVHLRENINTESPEDDPSDAAGAVTAAEGTWRVNIFSLRARLALLQAEAIEQVLSVKCCISLSKGEAIFKCMTSVLEELQSWRNHELFQMTADQLLQLLYRSDLIHVLGLEASYFATVFRLQAFVVLGLNTRVNPFSTDALAKLSEQGQHLCLKDAKRLLSILSVAPQGDIGVSWYVSP
jgi:hypothetical protein